MTRPPTPKSSPSAAPVRYSALSACRTARSMRVASPARCALAPSTGLVCVRSTTRTPATKRRRSASTTNSSIAKCRLHRPPASFQACTCAHRSPMLCSPSGPPNLIRLGIEAGLAGNHMPGSWPACPGHLDYILPLPETQDRHDKARHDAQKSRWLGQARHDALPKVKMRHFSALSLPRKLADHVVI